MSGHSDDPVEEESKRFFTFFNLSMILVAITGLEIVIIYVQTFEGSTIIGVLFATSILKFVGVVWWFMHLRWDKILNTILFLMGLVIALGTYFAVIYMNDEHPVVKEFKVALIENNWKADTEYKSGDYVLINDKFYQTLKLNKTKIELAINNDGRETEELRFASSFVNGKPVVFPQNFKIERRQKIDFLGSDVTTAAFDQNKLAYIFMIIKNK